MLGGLHAPAPAAVVPPVLKAEDGVSEAAVKLGTRIVVQKLYQFKISGLIGLVGAKDSVSYTSLSF